MVLLNEELAKRQKITQKQRDKLDKLYSKLAKLVKKASRDKDIKNNGGSYALKMEELEYKLQKIGIFHKINYFILGGILLKIVLVLKWIILKGLGMIRYIIINALSINTHKG